MNNRVYGLLLGMLLLLGSCGSVPEEEQRLPLWQAPRLQAHPDTGRIVNLTTGRQLTPQMLVAELAAVPLVLLGEKHDNPDHHRLQLWLLQALEGRREQGSLVLEMLTDTQQPHVDNVRQRLATGGKVEQLPQALEWNPGWDWQHYGPVLEYAIRQPWQLRAGNLDRDALMSIYRNPPELPPGPAGQQQVQAELAEIILDAHCGKLPEQQIPAMVAVQQQRDLRMMKALLDAPQPGLLIAGSYHVRKDLGVPLHLQEELPEQEYQVLIFLEAGQAVTPAMADYVWYTPATEEKDYCADL